MLYSLSGMNRRVVLFVLFAWSPSRLVKVAVCDLSFSRGAICPLQTLASTFANGDCVPTSETHSMAINDPLLQALHVCPAHCPDLTASLVHAESRTSGSSNVPRPIRLRVESVPAVRTPAASSGRALKEHVRNDSIHSSAGTAVQPTLAWQSVTMPDQRRSARRA